MFVAYEKIREKPPTDSTFSGKWVALEKLHGAHLSVVVFSGDDISLASRKRLLDDDEWMDFWGVGGLYPQLSLYAQSAFEQWGPCILRGELIGTQTGSMGPAGSSESNYSTVSSLDPAGPVQTGIEYGALSWWLYDVEVDGHYTDWNTILMWAMHNGIPLAPEWGRGSYQEMMVLSANGKSKLSPKEDRAEGVVIKPIKDFAVGARPHIKRKIDQFAEDARYHGARPPKPASWDLDAISWQTISLCLVPTRVESALSQLGPAASQQSIVEAVIDDVILDSGVQDSAELRNSLQASVALLVSAFYSADAVQ